MQNDYIAITPALTADGLPVIEIGHELYAMPPEQARDLAVALLHLAMRAEDAEHERELLRRTAAARTAAGSATRSAR